MLAKKNGFTLAEALITIVIVGSIAALTIPSLLADVSDSQNKSGAKNGFKILANDAVLVMTNNNGSLAGISGGNNGLKNAFANFLSVKTSCNDGASDGICWATGTTNLDGTPGLDPNAAGLILNNGMALQFKYDSTCTTTVGSLTNTCGYILLDYNGLSGSNKWGQDIFGFYIFPNNIWPFGWNGDSVYSISGCSTMGTGYAYPYIYDFTSLTGLGSCSTDTTLGQSCADANGVSAFYAGTCTDDTAMSDQETSNNYQQYYQTGYYNSTHTSQYDPTCNTPSNLYVSASPPASYCTRTGADPSDLVYGGHCYLSFQDGLNYCASLGVGWQVPSQDELYSMYSNNSSYGSNAFSAHQYFSSTVNEWSNSTAPDEFSVDFAHGSQPGRLNYVDHPDLRCVKSSS